MDIENISLIIQNDDEYGSPLSRITLNKMRLEMNQRKFDMDLKVEIQSLDGSYYFLKEEGEVLQESHLIGENNECQDWEVEDLLLKDEFGKEYIDLDQLDKAVVEMREFYNKLEEEGDKVVREVSFREYAEGKGILRARVNMDLDCMQVEMIMVQLYLVLQGGALLQLSTFAQLPPACWPQYTPAQLQ